MRSPRAAPQPSPPLDIAGASAFGDGGVGEQRPVAVRPGMPAECVDEPLKHKGSG